MFIKNTRTFQTFPGIFYLFVYAHFIFSSCTFVLVSCLSPLRRIPAKTEPDILCHTLKIAPGKVASGFAAKLAVASEIASPLFCIPTSMAIAVTLSYGTFRSLAVANPIPIPHRLCRITTPRTSMPQLIILSAFTITRSPARTASHQNHSQRQIFR